MPALSVPSPYDGYPRNVLSVFHRFHVLTGEWPWQLVEYFEPRYWSYQLVYRFYSLIKNELPRTGSVTLDDLVKYLFDKSAQHPMSKYRCVLSNKVIGQAIDWMSEKRQELISGFRYETRRRSATCGRDSEPMQNHASDSRKRSAGSAASNEEAQTPAAFAKKRLMVTFKFPPKPIGDCITVEGDESDQTTDHGSIEQANGERSNVYLQTGLITPVGENGFAEESPFLDVTFKTFEEAQKAYTAYLKGEITTSGNVIRRSEDQIEATSRRHRDLVRKMLQDDARKDNAASEVAEAQQRMHHAEELHHTEAEALREARRRAISNPSAAGPAQEIAELAQRERESGQQRESQRAIVEAKQRVLVEIMTVLKNAEAEAEVLQNRVIELGEAKETEEKNQRDLTILRRLIRLGPKLVDLVDELLGDRDIDEWSKEIVHDMAQFEE
ncbi:hypothetical protein FPOAC2_05728 [Fusarium poae]|uniref:hypothetical protein n=1 Tax=Fusarium poae TaxID=36050 RepID=UPI001CEA36F9|nr:hypothetical protein FPOAC1_005612 [Fusarium poae]KAG8672346.1 hypothetical protein FPOAC1_005612 [Fusarium poae]